MSEAASHKQSSVNSHLNNLFIYKFSFYSIIVLDTFLKTVLTGDMCHYSIEFSMFSYFSMHECW